MAVYRGEVGLQFTTHLAKRYSIPQWVELAEYAQRNEFSQLWVTTTRPPKHICSFNRDCRESTDQARNRDFGAVL